MVSRLTSARERKQVIIVGAGGRFGKNLSHVLSDQHFVSDIDYAEEPWFREHEQGGGVGGCDVTSAEDVLSLCQAFSFPVQGLVYLPRVRSRDRLGDVTLSNLLEEFSVTVGGLLHFIQALDRTQGLPSSGGLSVVAMSSVLARRVSSFEGLGYHLSKAASEQLVRFLAMELSSLHIRVNAVSPGWMVRSSKDLDDLGEDVRRSLTRVNSGKAPNTFYEVAEVVAFLLSDASHSLSGQVINVDGGVSNLETSFAAIGPLHDNWRRN